MKRFADTVRTEPGPCLFATGQAGFILKSASGQLLGIDLYLSDCVERLEGHVGFKRLLPQILEPDELVFDALICTHPHWDHFDVDAMPKLMDNGRTKLFCSADCKKYCRDLPSERITYVKPADRYEIGVFALEFINCDHGTAAQDAVGAVVTVDGRRVCEAGDTCLRLDRVGEIEQPLDVLIAPINGAFGNLNETECAALADALKPKVTVPCHYGMFASHHGDVGSFVEAMQERSLPFLLMRQGEAYRL